jgi:hypothetical protein
MPFKEGMRQAKKGELLELQKGNRGELYEFSVGEYMVHDGRTKAGWARGGDWHDFDSFVKMKYGSGKWVVEKADGSRSEIIQQKDTIIKIDAKDKHYFVALEDCAFDEWIDEPGPFVSYLDDKRKGNMREEVARINAEREKFEKLKRPSA